VRVEVIQELDPDDPQLEIPWASPAEPRLGYVDLKRFPEEVADLQECRQHPPLAVLVRRINRPESSFRSAKCDVWATTELADDERLDFDMPFKLASYVDLLFDHPELRSDLEQHLKLGERIGQSLRALRVQAQMEIAVRRCLFHPEERWGYYLTIFVHGYGATTAEAEAEWQCALEALGESLETIEQTLRKPGGGYSLWVETG